MKFASSSDSTVFVHEDDSLDNDEKIKIEFSLFRKENKRKFELIVCDAMPNRQTISDKSLSLSRSFEFSFAGNLIPTSFVEKVFPEKIEVLNGSGKLKEFSIFLEKFSTSHRSQNRPFLVPHREILSLPVEHTKANRAHTENAT